MEQNLITIQIGNAFSGASQTVEKKSEPPVSAELRSWSVMAREGEEKMVMEIILPMDSELEDSLRQITEGADSEKEELRKLLVEILNLSLRCWKAVTHKTRIELAEESRLWTVTTDMRKGTFRTQTFDRYTRVRTLPKRPRIGTVLDTAHFVLEKCAGHETEMTTELRIRMRQMEKMLKYV